jgi:hypothetical protein
MFAVVARRIAMKLKMDLGRVIVNALCRSSRSVSDSIVQEVPAELAFCEIVCRKEQCSAKEWATCERRLKRGAGEFMPVNR